MKNTKVELKDNELEEVNGGILIISASNTEAADEPSSPMVFRFP